MTCCLPYHKDNRLERTPVICIVDDDDEVRDATKSFVRSLGYLTASFSSAEEYLSSDRVDDTSCLITDLRMPGMNGVELQQRLIADGRKTKVIIVTGFPQERLRARALEAGAFGFLEKPFDHECLIECLERALQAAHI